MTIPSFSHLQLGYLLSPETLLFCLLVPFICLGFAGAWVLLIEQTTFAASKKPLQRKLLQQAWPLFFIGGIVTALVEAILHYFLYDTFIPDLAQSILPSLAPAPLLIGLLLLVALRAVWKNRKSAYTLGTILCIGVLAASAANALFRTDEFLQFTPILRAESLWLQALGNAYGWASPPSVLNLYTWVFFPPHDLGQAIFFYLCYPVLYMPLVYSTLCCWILLRRNADDFGRDYYTYALRRTARLGAITLVPAALGAGGALYFVVLMPGNLPGFAYWLAGIGILWVASLSCLLFITRHNTPLRCKLSTAFAFIFLLLGYLVFTAHIASVHALAGF